MSRETKINLGKRCTDESDKSCIYGVAFGETVVEVDCFDVTLCYHEKKTSDVCKRIVDLSVMQISERSYNSDYAYRDIPYDTAVKLERELRALIKLETDIEDYNKQIKLIVEPND